MFLEDLQSKPLEPVLSLDLLHLCRKGLKELEENSGADIGDTLGLMARSPLLLYRFLEWQEDEITSAESFHLTSFLLGSGYRNHLAPSIKTIGPLFLGKINASAILQHCRTFVIDHLPEAFSSKYDRKLKMRSGFINFNHRIPQLLEEHLNEASAERGSKSFSDDRQDSSKDNCRRLRRVLEEPIYRLFEDLLLRIERQIFQILGKQGIARFFRDVLEKVSFLSLVSLERGFSGESLYLLNLHVTTVAQLAKAMGESLESNTKQKIPGLPSSEDLYVMGLIHDLGHGLMATLYPELQNEIWERLVEQQALKEQQRLKNPRTLTAIEKDVITKHQLTRLIRECEKIDSVILIEHFKIHGVPLSHDENELKRTFAKLYLHASYCSEDDLLWVKDLWLQQNCPSLSPIPSSGALASLLLKSNTKEQEFVKGAYKKYARFLSAYHKEKNNSLSILLIRYLNHISTRIAEKLDFALPCTFYNIGDAESFVDTEALAEHLNMEVFELETLGCSIMTDFIDQWRRRNPYAHIGHQRESPQKVTMESVKNDDEPSRRLSPAIDPQRLKNDLQINISDFFKTSSLFCSAYPRFSNLNHQIITLLQDTTRLSPIAFVRELEHALKQFFLIENVTVIPREGSVKVTPEEHFRVIFKSTTIKDNMAYYHHRHLMADVYIMDSAPEKVHHPEIIDFLNLFCDHLLLNYSCEIWELFKSKSEISRLDIAKDIVKENRLGDGLEAQLLYFKARLLDGLVPGFSKGHEIQNISKVQFAVYNPSRSPVFELYSTADFDYWSTEKGSDESSTIILKKCTKDLGETLNRHFSNDQNTIQDQNNGSIIFQTLGTNAKGFPYFIVPLFDMTATGAAKFCIIIASSRVRHDRIVLQSLLDKGITHDLSKHQQASSAPIGYTFLQFFASDNGTSALNRITHLRPSRLKEMGLLLHQVRREVEPLLQRLPDLMEKALIDLLQKYQYFWDLHHLELSQIGRLPKTSLKRFYQLRKDADIYKKSIRMKIPDFVNTITDLPRSTLGKLKLEEPLICFPWGLEHLYLSFSDFKKFKSSVESKVTLGQPQLRKASEALHRLDSAWCCGHSAHWQHALTAYFEELSREPHITGSKGSTPCSLTLFIHDEPVPHFPASSGPFLALESFTPSQTFEGAHHRLVGSSGGGYNILFEEDFIEFCAIAHRNVLSKNNQFLMECFFRNPEDATSLSYAEPHMQKHRFFNSTGLSTLFFFPIKSKTSGPPSHHGF